MANITISDVHPAGSELFQGSESFLSDLTDHEQIYITGGLVSMTGLSVVRVPVSEDIYSVSISFVF